MTSCDALTEPVIDYTGEFHRIDRAGLLPLPHRRPHLGRRFQRRPVEPLRTSRDGFMFMRASSLARRSVQTIRNVAAEHGRDPEALGFESSTGPPRHMADAITQWSAEGEPI